VIALDLFCASGGTSRGLIQAGFDSVYGIDWNGEMTKYYPYRYELKNVFDLSIEYLMQFDFIWASPPCQKYLYSTKKWRNLGMTYPDLIKPTRKLLLKTGRPFVIENSTYAPIRKDLILCGEMFGLGVIRHRAFEINGFSVKQPIHKKHRGTVKQGYYVTVAGHGGDGSGKLKDWQKAMKINWIKDNHILAQAVPPAYSKYIGKCFLKIK